MTSNLPTQLTSFIGREQEATLTRHLLADARLLTLTGPGGCGRTRLAIQVASKLTGAYPDGLHWIELAPLADGDLVVQTIASALGVQDRSGRALDRVPGPARHRRG